MAGGGETSLYVHNNGYTQERDDYAEMFQTASDALFDPFISISGADSWLDIDEFGSPCCGPVGSLAPSTIPSWQVTGSDYSSQYLQSLGLSTDIFTHNMNTPIGGDTSALLAVPHNNSQGYTPYADISTWGANQEHALQVLPYQTHDLVVSLCEPLPTPSGSKPSLLHPKCGPGHEVSMQDSWEHMQRQPHYIPSAINENQASVTAYTGGLAPCHDSFGNASVSSYGLEPATNALSSASPQRDECWPAVCSNIPLTNRPVKEHKIGRRRWRPIVPSTPVPSPEDKISTKLKKGGRRGGLTDVARKRYRATREKGSCWTCVFQRVSLSYVHGWIEADYQG